MREEAPALEILLNNTDNVLLIMQIIIIFIKLNHLYKLIKY